MNYLHANLRHGLTGLIVGADLTGRSAALALLFFSGALQGGAGIAACLFMVSALAMIALGLRSLDMPAALAVTQSAPIAILLPSVAALAATGGALPAEDAVASAFAILGLTSVATGATFWLVARLGLDQLARLVPYPVVVGFMAGIGALLIVAALHSVAPGIAIISGTWADLPRANMMNLALSVAGVCALGLASRFSPQRGMILALAGMLAVFYAWMWLSGTSLQDARAVGLVYPASVGQIDLFGHLTFWSRIDWSVVAAALPLILASVVVSVLGLLLSVAGIEIATRSDIETARVLRLSGGLNVASGLAGSGPAYVSPASIAMAGPEGWHARATGIVACCVLAVSALQADAILAAVPRFLTASLLIYVGFRLLWDWFFSQYRRLMRSEWAIVAGILAITLAFGMIVAVGAGVLASALIFVLAYARLPVIRRSDTLTSRRSTVDRGPAQAEFLDLHAGRIVTVAVQGYLFFGSAHSLVARVKELLNDGPFTIILDFGHVSGVDAAAIAAFEKMSFLAERKGTRIRVSKAEPDVAAALSRAGLDNETSALAYSGLSADTLLEEAENRLLGEVFETDAEGQARRALEAHIADSRAVDLLLDRMDVLVIGKGETLIPQGAESSELYLIDSGRFSVYAQIGDGNRMRIRSFRPGAIVGEIAAYLNKPRTADVVADEDSRVYRIDGAVLAALERDNSGLALLWHKMMATVLAERTDRTTRLLRE